MLSLVPARPDKSIAMQAIEASAGAPSSEQDYIAAWMQGVPPDFFVPVPNHLLPSNSFDMEGPLDQTQIPLTSPECEHDEPLFHSSLDPSPPTFDHTIFSKINAPHNSEPTRTNEVTTSAMTTSSYPSPGQDGPNNPFFYPESRLDTRHRHSFSGAICLDQPAQPFSLEPFPTAKIDADPRENSIEHESKPLPLMPTHIVNREGSKTTDTDGDSPPHAVQATTWRDTKEYHHFAPYFKRKRNNSCGKRSTHSQAEKDYRERLTAKFKALSSALESPPMSGLGSTSGAMDSTQALSKAEILNLATEQLQALRREKKALLTELAKSRGFVPLDQRLVIA